jgi:hypothetical protein
MREFFHKPRVLHGHRPAFPRRQGIGIVRNRSAYLICQLPALYLIFAHKPTSENNPFGITTALRRPPREPANNIQLSATNFNTIIVP